MSNTPYRILAMGHLGGRNLGDEAMFQALVALAPAGRHVEWLVPVPDPDSAPPYPENMTLLPYSGKRLLAALGECDAYLVCGGTSFHDQYAGLRHRRHMGTMAKFIGLSAIARLRGKKALLLGIGVGPFSRTSTKMLTRLWAGLSTRVVVRDQRSVDFLSAGGLRAPRLQMACDLAQLLAPTMTGIAPAAASGARVLVNAMGLEAFHGTPPDQVAALYDQMAQALVTQHPQAQFDIVAIGVGTVDNDLAACDAFAAALRRHAPQVQAQTLTMTDPAEFIASAKSAALVVTTRLHAAVLSYLAGARVLGIVYHPKIPSVFETLAPQGSDRLGLIAPADGQDLSALLARVSQAQTGAPALPPDFERDRAVYAKALFGDMPS